MEKRWTLKRPDRTRVSSLQSALQIDETLCSILVSRGIYEFEEARSFFRPQLTDLHDPFLMKDMDKAVNRIRTAISRKEKILVFGDYDVDGTTAVAMMFQFLRGITDPDLIEFYIPHRYREGYGLSANGIQFAIEGGYSLIITLDCGIKSVDLISYGNSLSIDFIICDHHLPGSEIPPAVAILNPKQSDCNYPYKELCGCGVGFKLITAIAKHFDKPTDEIYCYLDLVATAIAADIVPITGENRVLTYFGLKKINEDPSPGIKALLALNGLKTSLNISNVVFIIAPRVNAAGRMDDARKAVMLFVEKDPVRAEIFAKQLHTDNTDRKEADSNITDEALELIQNDPEFANRRSTVLFRPHWHKGVVGIVASRLIEHYFRPTIILTQSGDYIAGSARSIPGFNIHDGLDYCSDLLLGFGGHYFAAGLTMNPALLQSFSLKFDEIVRRTVPEDLFTPEIVIDAAVEFKNLTPQFFRILNQMEPFGPENMNPVFVARNVINKGSRILKEKHIRFELGQGNYKFNGIGFNMASRFPIVESGMPLDIVFCLEENEFRDIKSLQLKVSDVKISNPDNLQ
ncbi:single-stranded-DNA-specific exonuclease RecJ [Pollutibacter soli]|uniref:single-stranded-DNA-specific exonuclease RecJ n=1 Tax=Pollutibacter soli TaxID=3034157 RepID=UPI003013DD4C